MYVIRFWSEESLRIFLSLRERSYEWMNARKLNNDKNNSRNGGLRAVELSQGSPLCALLTPFTPCRGPLITKNVRYIWK